MQPDLHRKEQDWSDHPVLAPGKILPGFSPGRLVAVPLQPSPANNVKGRDCGVRRPPPRGLPPQTMAIGLTSRPVYLFSENRARLHHQHQCEPTNHWLSSLATYQLRQQHHWQAPALVMTMQQPLDVEAIRWLTGKEQLCAGLHTRYPFALVGSDDFPEQWLWIRSRVSPSSIG